LSVTRNFLVISHSNFFCFIFTFDTSNNLRLAATVVLYHAFVLDSLHYNLTNFGSAEGRHISVDFRPSWLRFSRIFVSFNQTNAGMVPELSSCSLVHPISRKSGGLITLYLRHYGFRAKVANSVHCYPR